MQKYGIIALFGGPPAPWKGDDVMCGQPLTQPDCESVPHGNAMLHHLDDSFEILKHESDDTLIIQTGEPQSVDGRWF